MADEHDQQVHTSDREDTMLYRKPTDGSDEAHIDEIWGTKLETRVVDAKSDEFSQMLTEGWARSPTEIDGGKPVPAAGEVVAVKSADQQDPHAEARDAAEKLARELAETVKTLTKERDEAQERLKDASELIVGLNTDLSVEKALRAASAEHIRRLEGEAKAAKATAKQR